MLCNQSLKIGAEKQQRQTVIFLTSFPVFNSFPTVTFFKRYFTFFSETIPIKGSFVYSQDEKPSFFALLREGSYEVTSKMNIKEFLFNIWKDEKGNKMDFQKFISVLKINKYITDLNSLNEQSYYDVIFNSEK